MDVLTRTNLDMAEGMGLLDKSKIESNVPLTYKFVSRDEIKALVSAGIKYWPRLDVVSGPVFTGWVEPDTRDIIDLYYATEYADLSLTDFLLKVYGNGSDT